jgi:hypothetical protein
LSLQAALTLELILLVSPVRQQPVHQLLQLGSLIWGDGYRLPLLI